MNEVNWLKEHKKFLLELGKLNLERTNINKKIKESKKKLNVLDELLINGGVK